MTFPICSISFGSSSRRGGEAGRIERQVAGVAEAPSRQEETPQAASNLQDPGRAVIIPWEAGSGFSHRGRAIRYTPDIHILRRCFGTYIVMPGVVFPASAKPRIVGRPGRPWALAAG